MTSATAAGGVADRPTVAPARAAVVPKQINILSRLRKVLNGTGNFGKGCVGRSIFGLFILCYVFSNLKAQSGTKRGQEIELSFCRWWLLGPLVIFHHVN